MCVCIVMSVYFLALFSHHSPWSAEEPPDSANNIPLGPDTTVQAGGSLSKECLESRVLGVKSLQTV